MSFLDYPGGAKVSQGPFEGEIGASQKSYARKSRGLQEMLKREDAVAN